VALSTDDEGVSRSDMNLEYMRGVEEQGLTYPQLKQMAMNSIRYSFASDATKLRLARELTAKFADFEEKFGK
jgi:adenosine deaminase